MEWRGRRQSGNIEDRRGRGGAGAGIGGIGALAILLIGWYFGVDLTPLLNGGTAVSTRPADPAAAEFVAVTLADTEEAWARIFQAQVGRPYQPAMLVLYSGVT